MFESKLNRGKAGGYAPLDGTGKVPLDKLPPIQSTINTSSFATTGSNVFTGEQTISTIQGTGSIFLQPDSNDFRHFEIYNTQPSDVHFKANSGLSFFGDDTNYLKIEDSVNEVTLRAHQNIILETNSGDIILNPDGGLYKGSSDAGNSLITDSTLSGIIGDTNTINNSTGNTITDNLTRITNLIPTNHATTGSNTFNGDQTISGSLIFGDNTIQTTAFTGSIDRLSDSNLTFIDNTIEGNNVNAAGTKIEVATSKDNTVDLNGNGVYIAYNSTNNQVQVGWIVRFYDGTVRTINSKLFIDGYLAFGVEGNVELYPAYPLTIESPDYNVGDDPYLDFKVGDNIITLDSGSNLIGVNNLTTTTSFNSFTSSIQSDVNALTAQTSSYLTSNSISNLLSKTTGSWTITPGTANYSFTLDTNSTYQMWVLGNIPNGIISYNATVTISNANVPVLGTQSAWNYVEGGSPILLTTLPRQIVGVDGTISTTNPGGLGVNTNIFSFEIQNNTTGSVTVNYGYTKIS